MSYYNQLNLIQKTVSHLTKGNPSPALLIISLEKVQTSIIPHVCTASYCILQLCKVYQRRFILEEEFAYKTYGQTDGQGDF